MSPKPGVPKVNDGVTRLQTERQTPLRSLVLKLIDRPMFIGERLNFRTTFSERHFRRIPRREMMKIRRNGVTRNVRPSRIVQIFINNIREKARERERGGERERECVLPHFLKVRLRFVYAAWPDPWRASRSARNESSCPRLSRFPFITSPNICLHFLRHSKQRYVVMI